MSEAAPLFDDIADGPSGGRAEWVRTGDGVRLRIAVWPAGARGRVLLLPGRTEYVEKYGRTAAALAARGYGCIAVDWRGQGLSDRACVEPRTGHVARFADYQADLDAVLDHLGADAPPFWLAHSMGGAIALRAMIRGPAPRAVVLTAPMWGIGLSPGLARLARVLAGGARLVRQGHRFAPGTGLAAYVEGEAFEANMLTRDAETYAWLRGQVKSRPALAVAGPSLQWLGEAMAECRALSRLPSPAVPALCVLGEAERIVDPRAVHDRMARWPGGTLDLVPGAEHEVMMEVPPVRERFHDRAAAFFDANA